MYEENSIIDCQRKSREIFVVVVAVKEIDSINRKDTTSQMHSILKEVLFIVNNGKLRSQNKNKQQLKDSLTESVDKLSSFSDFYLPWFVAGTLLWKEINSVKQSKSHNFSFNKHCRTLSKKYFIKYTFHVRLKWVKKLTKNGYEDFIKNIIWRNHWKKITEKMNE